MWLLFPESQTGTLPKDVPMLTDSVESLQAAPRNFELKLVSQLAPRLQLMMELVPLAEKLPNALMHVASCGAYLE